MKETKNDKLYLKWIKPKTNHSSICLCNSCLQSEEGLIPECNISDKEKAPEVEFCCLECIEPRTTHSSICLCNSCLQYEKLDSECILPYLQIIVLITSIRMPDGREWFCPSLHMDIFTHNYSLPIWINYDHHIYDDPISTDTSFCQIVRTAKMMNGG